MISEIKRLFISDDVKLISYKSLEESQAYEQLCLDEGITVERIPLYLSKSLLFLTEIPKGSAFNKHYHDCKEIINVKVGSITYQGRHFYPGEKLIIHSRVVHEVKAREDSVLYVQFIRPI